MAALPTPLVRRLERLRGQQDHRWVHLLGPMPEGDAGRGRGARRRPGRRCSARAPRRGTPRSWRRTTPSPRATPTSWADELDEKPFDRWLLARVAWLAGELPVVEVGCGPGHVAAFLAATGTEVTGVDLSPGMVDEARRRHPEVAFEVGDLTRLMRPPTAAGWGAVVGWYSLIHLAPSEIAGAVGALARVVAPGGWVALALHAGAAVRHVEDWWDHPVDLDFVLHDPARSARPWRRPGWWSSSGTSAAPSRASRPTPSGSTSSPASPAERGQPQKNGPWVDSGHSDVQPQVRARRFSSSVRCVRNLHRSMGSAVVQSPTNGRTRPRRR